LLTRTAELAYAVGSTFGFIFFIAFFGVVRDVLLVSTFPLGIVAILLLGIMSIGVGLLVPAVKTIWPRASLITGMTLINLAVTLAGTSEYLSASLTLGIVVALAVIALAHSARTKIRAFATYGVLAAGTTVLFLSFDYVHESAGGMQGMLFPILEGLPYITATAALLFTALIVALFLRWFTLPLLALPYYILHTFLFVGQYNYDTDNTPYLLLLAFIVIVPIPIIHTSLQRFRKRTGAVIHRSTAPVDERERMLDEGTRLF